MTILALDKSKNVFFKRVGNASFPFCSQKENFKIYAIQIILDDFKVKELRNEVVFKRGREII